MAAISSGSGATPQAKRFHVALSFPGEHRAFVKLVAERLATVLGRARVLYDDFYTAEFARPDLDTYLQRLYREESELVVVFLCAEYERKDWCRLEWRAVRDLIKVREAASVMPMRFDDTAISGLFGGDGYVWLPGRSAEEVAALILERHKASTSWSRPQPTITDPSTAELVAQRNALERQLAEERASGADFAATAAALVEVKRRLRAGGRLRAGDRLDGERYELLELVGKGGFGVVWKAWDEVRRELVAIKVLDDHGGHGGQRKERFFRGARQMARLDHPGIVKVLEVEKEDDGWAFFVMEYLAGGDLHRGVLEKRVTQEQGLQAVFEAGEGLAFAHSKGLVHRDVKPHNILLTADGRAKLTDFDLVRALDTTGGTGTKAGAGTFLYMAPEAMNSAKSVRVEADVYSLAMTACFVFHGEELPSEALVSRMEFLSGLTCEERVRAVLMVGIEHRPSQRPLSVAAFLSALQEALVPPRIEVTGLEAAPSQVHSGWSKTGEDKYGHWAALEVRGVEHRMRWIPPGRFWMGSPEGEEGRRENEGPRHEVELTRGFWLGEVPCTQALWEAVMGWNPSRFLNPGHPVEQVSWEDCQRFLSALEEKRRSGGLGLRLPTEAEWEYACRAGTETTRYQSDLDAIAWYEANSGGTNHRVGSKAANAWGLFDMLGNVWELCDDFYGSYAGTFERDPRGALGGQEAVIRGGASNEEAQYVRAAVRHWARTSYHIGPLGFRLARSSGAALGQPGGEAPGQGQLPPALLLPPSSDPPPEE
jgi:eukaryotic-like serine/threonine-protein kinase